MRREVKQYERQLRAARRNYELATAENRLCPDGKPGALWTLNAFKLAMRETQRNNDDQ